VGLLAFKVLLDTSMLMMIAEKRMDVFRQIETALRGKVDFMTPKMVLEELSRISQEKSQRGRRARLALKLAEKSKLGLTNPIAGESTDDYLTRLAREIGGIIATGDAELRERLRNANMPVIYVRKDSRLAVEGIEPAYR